MGIKGRLCIVRQDRDGDRGQKGQAEEGASKILCKPMKWV